MLQIELHLWQISHYSVLNVPCFIGDTEYYLLCFFVLFCTKVLSDKTRQKVNLFSVWFIGMDCGNFKGMFELEYIENQTGKFLIKKLH